MFKRKKKIELKPCPFCGGEAKMVKGIVMETNTFVCEGCGADVMFFGAELDARKAIEAWNRRVEKGE